VLRPTLRDMPSDPLDETSHDFGAADEGAATAERDALSQQGSASDAGAIAEDEPCSSQTKLEEAEQGRWRNVGEFVVIAVPDASSQPMPRLYSTLNVLALT